MSRKFGKIPGLGAAKDNTGDELEAMEEERLAEGYVQAHEAPGQLLDEDEVHYGGQGGAHGHQADAQEQEEAKSIRCKTCCCEAHHQLSIHYSGNKYIELPAVNCEGVGPGLTSLVMQNNMDDKGRVLKNNLGGLEEIVMSVDVNLDEIM